MTAPTPGAALPEWAERMRQTIPTIRATQLSKLNPAADGPAPRQAAVLMLFGPGPDGDGEVLLTQRAARMRSHAGQVAFPGGAIDPGDDGPIAAALREAQEETGLDPAGVDVLGVLPQVYVLPSHFHVTPVVGWWRAPSPVAAVDPVEVERVAVVQLPDLLDPANRFSTRLRTGFTGPAFEVDGLFVWGFTAGLLAHYLRAVGLERAWDQSRLRPVPGLSEPVANADQAQTSSSQSTST